MLAAESPHQVMNEWTSDPREILDTYAAAIRANMLTYSIWAGNYALVIAKQQRDTIAAAGWSKRDIREYVFEPARVRRGDWRTVGKAAVAARQDEDAGLHRATLARRPARGRRRGPGGRLRRRWCRRGTGRSRSPSPGAI